ncbi:hypothetical protein [Fodinibius sp. SL11]|uniref:hypothetical protein n=1 Tax=Fodinibius sp. SL11 TaxID=3425690 RepID=UPI003F885822
MIKLILKKLRYFDLVIYLRNNYALFAKYYTYLSLVRKEIKHPILVYTMGKVGSTTITYSLKNQLEEYSVYHLHWLNERNLNTDQKFLANHLRKNKDAGIKIDVFPNYLSRGFYFSNKFARSGGGINSR